MPLVRIGKRRAVWDEPDPDEIAKTEFRNKDGSLDLRPSVYEVDGSGTMPAMGQVVRVHAEHTVSLISPPRGDGDDVVVDGCGNPTVHASAGDTQFDFANARHRELYFETDEDLVEFVRQVLATLPARRVQVSRGQLFAYIASRVDMNDPEWVRALGRGEAREAKGWNQELAKWRKREAEAKK